jgi:uncharacterized protein YcgI (DUF1989 family)
MADEQNLSTPEKAREHARAQAGTAVRAMPTIPAANAKDLPPGVQSREVLWDETIDAGEYCSRILHRGARLRITNLEGDGCVNFLIYNADRPIERLNVADTVKVQWNAYLGEKKLLLSDMSRVLMSILQDTCGNHDTLCGASNEKSNARKYGHGENYSDRPNARDRFMLALLKHGLGRKDMAPCINLFKTVRVETDGSLKFIQWRTMACPRCPTIQSAAPPPNRSAPLRTRRTTCMFEKISKCKAGTELTEDTEFTQKNQKLISSSVLSVSFVFSVPCFLRDLNGKLP